MKLKLPYVSFDDDEINMMVDKMDLNKDKKINVAELLELIGILNLSQFEEEIKFMFSQFADKTGTGKIPPGLC